VQQFHIGVGEERATALFLSSVGSVRALRFGSVFVLILHKLIGVGVHFWHSCNLCLLNTSSSLAADFTDGSACVLDVAYAVSFLVSLWFLC